MVAGCQFSQQSNAHQVALRRGDGGAASLANWLTNTLASGLNRPCPKPIASGLQGGAVAAEITDSRSGPRCGAPRGALPLVGSCGEALRRPGTEPEVPAAPLLTPVLLPPILLAPGLPGEDCRKLDTSCSGCCSARWCRCSSDRRARARSCRGWLDVRLPRTGRT